MSNLPTAEEMLHALTENRRQARAAGISDSTPMIPILLPSRLAPPDVAIHFVIPTPVSSKNARRARVVPRKGGGKPIIMQYRPQEVIECRDMIQEIAVAALKAQARECFDGRRPFLLDEDCAVELVHNVHNETCDVTIRKRGPKPRGTTGRKRDVQNLPEIVLDAIQGIAYSNDNQVVDLRVYRNLGKPTTDTE